MQLPIYSALGRLQSVNHLYNSSNAGQHLSYNFGPDAYYNNYKPWHLTIKCRHGLYYFRVLSTLFSVIQILVIACPATSPHPKKRATTIAVMLHNCSDSCACFISKFLILPW